MVSIPPTMRPAGGFTIAAEHPCLDGHFPGNPVVPGVVLLDEAFARIHALHPVGLALTLETVKFSAPVLPGEAVEVGFAVLATPAGKPQRVSFVCACAGRVVITGTAGFAAPAGLIAP